MEDILIGVDRANLLPQLRAERLHAGEDDLTRLRLNGIALHKVEEAIRVGIAIGVQTIQSQHTNQQLIGGIALRQVVHVGTCRVALIHHVQLELLLLHRIGSQGIDILHHQVPIAHIGRHGRTFQQLHIKAIGGVRLAIRRELTHLIGLAPIDKAESHTEHLIRLQLGAQRDITQFLIQGIFRSLQQAGTLYLLKVSPTLKGATQCLRHLADAAGIGELRVQRRIEVVGLVIGTGIRAGRDHSRSDMRLVVLCQVGKGHDIAALVIAASFVGNPHLDTRDLDAGGDRRQRLHELIVIIPEVV